MPAGAFGNYFVPLLIGARDMAFPRMNALSYWIYLLGGVFMYVEPRCSATAPDAGWFSYVPLAGRSTTPGPRHRLLRPRPALPGVSSTVGAINFIVTILKMRAPGMSLNRMPLFVWAILATAFSLLFALPALTLGERRCSSSTARPASHFFDVAAGGDPLLWQHLFWIFGHPDVYIILLPGARHRRVDRRRLRAAAGSSATRRGRARDGESTRSSASASGCTTCSRPACRS